MDGLLVIWSQEEMNQAQSTHVGGHLAGCCDEKHTLFRERALSVSLSLALSPPSRREVTQVHKDTGRMFAQWPVVASL